MKPTKVTSIETPDYKNLVDLLAIASVAEQRLAEIQTEIDDHMIAAVDDVRADYITHQTKLAEATEAIEHIVRRNPQWFGDAKTLKTPYGSVLSKSSTTIKVASEESSIRLIEHAGRDPEFVRTVKTLDKEALEKLTDDELARFGLVRESRENVTIKPAKVDLGKAVKAAQAKEAA